MSMMADMMKSMPMAGMAGMQMPMMQDCIEACSAAAMAATMCADADGGEGMGRCASMCMSTADVATTMMRMMMRPAGYDMGVMTSMMTACMTMGEACAAECDDARRDVRALPHLRLGVHGDGRGVPDGDVLDADGLTGPTGRAEYQAPPRATTSATRCTATGSPGSAAALVASTVAPPSSRDDGDRAGSREMTIPSRQALGEAVATASWIGRRSIRVRFGTVAPGRAMSTVGPHRQQDGVGLRRGAAGQVLPAADACRELLRAAGTGRTDVLRDTFDTDTGAST